MKLVNMHDSKSCAARFVGSSPTSGTFMDDSRYNSIFWIEIDKIKPNPYQPRREFDEGALRDLSDSIRQYGLLQPLVVFRKEVEKEDGGLATEYELIAGERRLRASKLAGLYQVPAIIRSGEQTDNIKLELAIIENLQREDLNPVDRAQAFVKLSKEFNLRHHQIAKKIGKSRVYVTNTMRMMSLPQEILDAIVAGQITEGHTRPILMLIDRPEEQYTLFQEIINKRLTVREAELIARRIAYEKAKNKAGFLSPDIINMEEELTEFFGTRVKVEKKRNGGRVTIDFMSEDDLKNIFKMMSKARSRESDDIKINDDWSDNDFKDVSTEEKKVICEELPTGNQDESLIICQQENSSDLNDDSSEQDDLVENYKSEQEQDYNQSEFQPSGSCDDSHEGNSGGEESFREQVDSVYGQDITNNSEEFVDAEEGAREEKDKKVSSQDEDDLYSIFDFSI